MQMIVSHNKILVLDILYVLGMQANLLSASLLKDSGMKLQDVADEMLLVSAAGDVLGRKNYTGRVLYTDLRPSSQKSMSVPAEVVALPTIASATKLTPDMWHAWLAHVGVEMIKSSEKHEVAVRLDIKHSTAADLPCASCVGSKLAWHTFLDQGSNAENALAMVHIDLCGPLIVKKSEALVIFEKWLKLAGNCVLVTMVVAVGDADVVDTLETRLEDVRRRHLDGEYGPNLPLAVVAAGIRAVWAAEHPPQPASPRPANTEGSVDVGVNVGDQVGSCAEGTSRQRGVIHADEVGGVQARGLQTSAAAGSSQGDVGGRQSSVTLASATHVTAVGRHDLLTWKEAIETQLEMAGLMCFADGTVATPPKSNPKLRAEFRAVQLLNFTVILRCCSSGVQIALKSCRDYLDAGHQPWQFIKSTYQVTDDLYIG
ncbi:unnamed protein product [Closterium sp. NIES-54]